MFKQYVWHIHNIANTEIQSYVVLLETVLVIDYNNIQKSFIFDIV